MSASPPADRYRIATVGFALVGVALVWLGTHRYGVALTPDAIHYIAAARHLLTGEGLTNAGGAPVVKWPPLFSLLLAGFGRLGLEPALAARGLNAILLGLCMVAAGEWLRTRVRSTVLVLALAALVTAQPLLDVAAHAWSETLFTFWLLCMLLAAERYRTTPTTGYLVVMALFTALAVMTRLPGVTLGLVGGLMVLIAPGRSIGGKINHLGWFGLITITPLFAWLWRNWQLTHTLLGDRQDALYGPLHHIGTVVHTVTGWLLPPLHGISPLPLLSLAALGWVLTLSLAAFVRTRHYLIPRRPLPLATLLFALIYPLFLILVRSNMGAGPIEARFLVPMLPVFVLLLAFGVERAVQRWEAVSAPIVGRAMMTGIGVWLLVYPTLNSAAFLIHQYQNGAGDYATTAWQSAMVFKKIHTQPLPGVVFSNRPEAVYWFSGRPALSISNRWNFTRTFGRKALNNRLAAGFESGQPVWILWINATRRPFEIDEPHLKQALDLATAGRFPDGSATLYRVLSSHVRQLPEPGTTGHE